MTSRAERIVDDKWGSRPGNMADSFRRLFDQRREPRSNEGSQTAVMSFRGADHVVRVVDLSSSGAMVRFPGELTEGEAVTIQLLDHGLVAGQVRWRLDGRVGILFTVPIGKQGSN